MKRTSPALLVTVAVLAAIAGYLADQVLTASGRPTFTPSALLPVLLVLLGAITVVLALPIRRATRGGAGPRVDPFRAVRIAMLAKASSLVGAGVAGAALGMLGFLLTRPVLPGAAVTAVAVTALGAGVLVAAGLYAEHLCTIPGSDDDEPPPPEPGITPSHH